ncbi:LysM domain-containing protein [Chloroflexi bacterium TSY]|nr:LysM domain-containing protein [Chloroflexi bacterium TSY]MBV7329349.1 LysM domain-containing protein [Chloroflexi bacterium TSY]
MIHTIQSGDSLLAIADRYDLSVAALQEANGILDPRALQIGQQLIIPRIEELNENEVATATPTPLPVSVENVYFSETTIGGLWVLGEVLNDSGVPLEQVRVGVTLLDESESELAQASGLVALDFVDVNERAPFAILFGAAPGRFDQYRTYPISAVGAYIGSYYRDLEIRGLKSEGERYASYTVSVQVVLTAYDNLGRVIAMRQVVPDHNVVPRGGETTFIDVLVPIGGPVERIEAVAQGRRLQQ